MEATIISWLFNEGDMVKEDDSVVEIATDKVDSDVPTPVSGKIVKILKQKDEVAKIGEAIAILEVAGEGEAIAEQPQEPKSHAEVKTELPNVEPEVVKVLEESMESGWGMRPTRRCTSSGKSCVSSTMGAPTLTSSTVAPAST